MRHARQTSVRPVYSASSRSIGGVALIDLESGNSRSVNVDMPYWVHSNKDHISNMVRTASFPSRLTLLSARRTPSSRARQKLSSWVLGMLKKLASLLGEVILGLAGLGEMGLRCASGYPILQPQKEV